MKKSLLLILVSLCFAGTALAAPMTWVDTIDWENDILLTDASILNEGSDQFSYYHDLGNDGFVSFFEGGNDYVSSYSLMVGLYDDNDNKREKALVIQPGIDFIDDDAVTTYNFNLEFADIGWTVAGLFDINHDGTLNITVEPVKGDFYLDWSTLTAYGDNGDTAPVPEPATLLLLGSGLAGLAFYRRKRK